MAIETILLGLVGSLDREEAIQEYFPQAMADSDIDEIIRALGYIARARHGRLGGENEVWA